MKRLTPSVVALVVANLVPVYGVIALDWKVFPIILLFWLENVIIGALNVLRMLCTAPADPVKWLGKLFLIPFFCVHYGMFTMVHGVFVLGLFGGSFRGGTPFPSVGTVLAIVREQRLEWALLSLALSHVVSFVFNFLGRGEYQRAGLQALMQQPYGRVVVLHLTILGGGFLVMAMHSPVLGLLLLVALKIGLDLRAHLRERERLGETATLARSDSSV